eukprot:TRINITY_DN43692_c0_g1_i1.p1 TRINITY_DN43692_c0_g1~~TRINITY_DN43692_c0_g1_i1.p1  ORF type:complete len:305 (-),score=79.20 TRINITY_DN43692_c0_g1_i1:72-911(-)
MDGRLGSSKALSTGPPPDIPLCMLTPAEIKALPKHQLKKIKTNAEEKVIPESGGHQNLTRKQQRNLKRKQREDAEQILREQAEKDAPEDEPVSIATEDDGAPIDVADTIVQEQTAANLVGKKSDLPRFTPRKAGESMRNFVDRVEREGRAHIALVNKRETKTHLKKKERAKARKEKLSKQKEQRMINKYKRRKNMDEDAELPDDFDIYKENAKKPEKTMSSFSMEPVKFSAVPKHVTVLENKNIKHWDQDKIAFDHSLVMELEREKAVEAYRELKKGQK